MMKRRFIVPALALALSAGAAFAQDIPNPPGAVSPGNVAVVEQVGTGNFIGSSATPGLDQTVNGAGSGNYANIYQGYTNVGTSTSSHATVSQTATGGALNISYTSQFGTNQTANVTQNNAGAGQFITWVQQGSQNNGNILQGSAGNQATIDQAVTVNGTFVTWGDDRPDFLTNLNTVAAGAGVWQSGQNGIVSVTQRSSGALALVHQNGNGNGLTVNVNISQTGSAANTAIVEQDGSNGQIIVQQYGPQGVTNVSNINQSSNNSYASVTQYGLIGGNTSTITQNAGLGSDKAYVTQDAESSSTNSSTITQQDGSYANVYQQSNYAANTSTIGQTGQGNTVYVRQH